MTLDELRQWIGRIRDALDAHPDGPMIGSIGAGNATATCQAPAWLPVLAICDGARLGCIDLWAGDEMARSQLPLEGMAEAERLLVVGQILYEPVVIERDSGALFWRPRHAASVALGSPEHFLGHFALGRGYAEIVPDVEQDPWWRFLEEHGNL